MLGDYFRKLTETGLAHDDLKLLLDGAARMNDAMEKLVKISGAKPNANQTRARSLDRRLPIGPALPGSVAIWLRSPADAYPAGQIGSHR
jgi:hypothetical protein